MADVENSNGASNKVDAEDKSIKTKVVVGEKEKKGIVRQIEHYFGDYNLPKDKFLLEETKLNDGWVSMETMLKFKRLAALCDDASVILEILAAATSGLMEVDAAGSKIRRVPSKPVPEWNDERKAQLAKQTVYVKGFDKENSTLDGLIEFFEEKLGSDVMNVQMRNYQDKKDKNKKGFKGSLMVTFKDRESAEKFLALEEFLVKGEKGAEAKSVRMWQEDYNAEKQREWEETKAKKKEDKNKLKKAKQGSGDNEAGDQKNDTKEEESEEKEEGLPKGSVLVLSGLNGETTREDIKEKLKSEHSVDTDDIAFVYYQKGEETAKLRFKTEGAAVAVAKKIEGGKLEVKGAETAVKALEGEEEEAFLKQCSADIKAQMAKRKQGHKFGHKRRGGGRGGGPSAKRGRR